MDLLQNDDPIVNLYQILELDLDKCHPTINKGGQEPFYFFFGIFSNEMIKCSHHNTLKMSVAEMRMLRWMFGKSRKDRIKNERFWEHLEVALIGDHG